MMQNCSFNLGGQLQLPEQEFRGVVKSEHVVIVFNVILIEKRVELLQLAWKWQTWSKTFMHLNRTTFWRQIFASVYDLYNEVKSSCRSCVYTHTYHSGISQVQSVPAEALREAVRLLTYAVFVGFNAAMRCHRLPWKRNQTSFTKT